MRRLIVASVLFAFATLSAVFIPRTIARIVDEVLIKRSAGLSTWLWPLVVLMLVKVVCDIRYKWMVTKLGQEMTAKLRNDVFHRLGVFPLNFFSVNSSGRLISRCVNDVSNLSAFFTANFFNVLSDMAIIVGSLVMLMLLSPWAGLVVLLLLTPFAVYMVNVSQSQMHNSREQRHILSRMTGHTADTLNNLGVLHSQPFSGRWSRRHAALQQLFAGHNTRGILTWGIFSSMHKFVTGLAYTAVVCLNVYAVQHGKLSLGNFIASCTYVMMIFDPFMDIADKLNTVLNALSSAKRLRGFSPTISHLSPPAIDTGASPRGDIKFEKMNFSYGNGQDLFRQFDLTLPQGEITALVGRTGSGKTSLAHLLLGLYPLQGGTIHWGMEDFLQFTPERRARWVSQVSQDLFLFSDTLRENLRLWNTAITDAMIYNRLERMNLASKTKQLPQGLDTIVKAESLPFSQGERQLLLLCRALLQDPQLLVFDEATASLDQLTEEHWLAQVHELFAGRTTLFIAHRLETLRLAHHVVVLSQGKIMKRFTKEPGTPVREEDLDYS